MLADHRRGDLAGRLDLPEGTLRIDDRQSGGLHGILEPELALLAVESGLDSFEHADLVSGLELAGHVVSHHFRPRAVVGADERHLHTLIGEDLGIELVINVDHRDSGFLGVLAGRDQGFGIGRGDHDRVNPLGNHLLDQIDLALQVALVLDPVDDQLVLRGVLALVLAGALGHRLERTHWPATS